MSTIKNGIIEVDNKKYTWSIYRQPMWTRGRVDGYTLLGLAILIQSIECSRRDLLIEFKIESTLHGGKDHRQRFRVNSSWLTKAIELAIKAGWDPESRGKRFVYQSDLQPPR